MWPTLFVSHGAPTLPITDAPAKQFLATLGSSLGRPAAILVVSAHWETPVPTLNAVAVNDTIHDFGRGFPAELFQLRYPAPGSAQLAHRVRGLLEDASLPASVDARRGLDHGAWVPLMLMYAAHDVPVVQLSLQSDLGPAHHLAVGRALATLRDEDVLVIGSGSFTHDLSEFRAYRDALGAPEPAWVTGFADWFDAALAGGRIEDLIAYRTKAPFAIKNHPTEEHLLPLYVALGAAGERARAERLHASITHGVIRMDVYAFHSSTGAVTPA